MAVGIYQVNEIQGRGGRILEDGTRTYQRLFQVLTTTPLDGALAISQTNQLPRMYDPYVTLTEYDLGARVVSIDPHETEDPGRWEVAYEYSSKLSQPEQAAISAPATPSNGTPIPTNGVTPELATYQANPLSRQTKMRWRAEKVERAVMKDLADEPIMNSAGTRFPLTIQEPVLVLSISRNEAAFDPNTAFNYMNAVNTDTWFGFPPFSCRIDDISAEDAHEENLYFWKVSYVIHISARLWRLEILDEGTHERVSGVLQSILDNAGRPVSEPVPLDGAGQRLTNVTATTVRYRRYVIYPRS